MRSNIVYFLAALALFTAVYVVVAYTNVVYFPESDYVKCLSAIDPTVICGAFCFGFFLICTKRYTYDEAYLYGQSRKGAFFSALACAAVYAVTFALYALGVAILVRRSMLCSPELAVSADLYRLTATDILYNLAFLITVNLIAYEAANLLRKFKSWKFWVTIIVCIATLAVLYIVITDNRVDNDGVEKIKWSVSMLLVFVPQLLIMISGDFLSARGRVSR